MPNYIYVDHDGKVEKSSDPEKFIIKRKVPNPAPLGFAGLALTVMLTSFYNYQAFGIPIPNAIAGVAMFFGGAAQFAAGMWEYKLGNNVYGTGFSAYGGLWAGYAALWIPIFGIHESFAMHYKFLHGEDAVWNPEEDAGYNHAMGVFCLSWFMFTTLFTLATTRTNVATLSAFSGLTATFCAFTIAHLGIIPGALKVGGVIGMITSIMFWYCAAASFAEDYIIRLPIGDLSHRRHSSSSDNATL